MPRQPRRRNTGTATRKVSLDVALRNTGSSNDVAERRRERYEERQDRLRFFQQEENFAQRRRLYTEITEQSRGIQEYAAEEPGGNDSTIRLNQMVVTAELLIQNIRRMQRLGRDAHAETRLYSQQKLDQLEQRQQGYLRSLEVDGISERSIRLFIRRTDEQRRSLLQHRERVEQSFHEEDENMESLQLQVRRVIEHFRERERYNAVRSAFLQPTTSLADYSKDYRTSTGRILTSTTVDDATQCHGVSSVVAAHPKDSCGLSAQFGDNDMTPIEHGICVICLHEYEQEDTIVRNAISESHTRCNHLFHETCINSWIESSRKAECPCCRQPFVVKS